MHNGKICSIHNVVSSFFRDSRVTFFFFNSVKLDIIHQDIYNKIKEGEGLGLKTAPEINKVVYAVDESLWIFELSFEDR